MKQSDAILSTLKYSSHYLFPLTLDELLTRLIQVKTTKNSLSKELSKLVHEKKIFYQSPYYYLPGHVSDISNRHKNHEISQKKLAKAFHLSKKLSLMPGVLAIFLTGSLAVGNARLFDDIDFMIITERSKLWLTRLILTLYCELLGIRRRPGCEVSSDKLCLNLYLTPDSLLVPAFKRSQYTAYELIQVTPLHDPLKLHTLLLSSNSWLGKYLPNFIFPESFSSFSYKTPHIIFRILNNLAYYLQSWFMASKITSEFVTPDSAYFHPNNPAPPKN